VWREIFQSNRPALREALEAFRASLEELEKLVAEDDGERLERKLEEIRQLRSRLQ
jgi:prephenate dehydrogenase